MTDHIDTSAEREKLAGLTGYTPGPWAVGIDDGGNPLSGRPCVSASEDLDCGIVHWDGFVQEYWRSARGDKEIHANARLIAAAPDLLATIHRLLDALDAERERAEKSEAERDTERMQAGNHWETLRSIRYIALTSGDLERIVQWVDDAGCGYSVTAEDTLAQVMDERNHALARLAAAYEAVANIARSHIYYDSAGSGFSEDEFNDDIRAITPADAEAALQRVVDSARLEGWRAGRDEAADEAQSCTHDPYVVRAIRALPEPKETNHD